MRNAAEVHPNTLVLSTALASMSFVAGTAFGAPSPDDLVAQGKFGSATAQAVSRACGHQTLDDYWIAVGICINEPETADRKECFDEAKATRDEDHALCAEQRTARLDLCAKVGESRYDPEFEGKDFE